MVKVENSPTRRQPYIAFAALKHSINRYLLIQKASHAGRLFLYVNESVNLLLDLGSLTDAIAQVVEFRTAHFTDTDHLDTGDVG